jgi:hypothetical protein
MQIDIARLFFIEFSDIKFHQNWFMYSRIVLSAQIDGRME